MTRSKTMATVTRAFAIVMLSLSWSAQATPLGLTLADAPDVVSAFIDVSFNAATGTLTATGFAMQFDDGVSAVGISGGLYTLEASLDGGGNLTGGSFTIGGTISSLGFNSGTLLTGDLTDFGFVVGGGDPFEFLFAVTGGDLAPAYAAMGGMILSNVGFGGSFTEDFQNSADGFADTSAIPVPAAVWLMLSALAGIAGFRKR